MSSFFGSFFGRGGRTNENEEDYDDDDDEEDVEYESYTDDDDDDEDDKEGEGEEEEEELDAEDEVSKEHNVHKEQEVVVDTDDIEQNGDNNNGTYNNHHDDNDTSSMTSPLINTSELIELVQESQQNGTKNATTNNHNNIVNDTEMERSSDNNNIASTTTTSSNVIEIQNLLFLAIEADRVDIVQELLSSSLILKEYLMNPIIRIQDEEHVVAQEVVVAEDHNKTTTNDSNTSSTKQNDKNNNIDNKRKKGYICTTIPPLHIAMYYGSINVINYLLRTGIVNPTLRPNIQQMKYQYNIQQQLQLQQEVEKEEKYLPEQQQQQQQYPFVLDHIPHLEQYDNCTAWEVAFGKVNDRYPTRQQTFKEEDNDRKENDNDSSNNNNNGSWSMFRSSSNSSTTSKKNNNNKSNNPNLTILKLDSIRHAFFTEAIRCISIDDVQRFTLLYEAGMPIYDIITTIDHTPVNNSNVEMSTFTFTKWCHDFQAQQCLQYIQTMQQHNIDDSNVDDINNKKEEVIVAPIINGRKLPLSNHVGGLVVLQNRYEELNALCRSLSICLDNIAEEVSVGAGLLFSSNASSSGDSKSAPQALALHVRLMKQQREQVQDEYQRYYDSNQNTVDELLYYIQTYYMTIDTRGNSKKYSTIRVEDINEWWEHYVIKDQQSKKDLKNEDFLPSITSDTAMNGTGINDATSSDKSKTNIDDSDNNSDDQLREKEQNMVTQIMILETKICRLRATISDLSDENIRNQKEIENRSLMVGLQYIRTLRNEIRDMEYSIYEMKQYDIDCRNKIRTIQALLSSSQSKQGQQSMKQTLALNTDVSSTNNTNGTSKPVTKIDTIASSANIISTSASLSDRNDDIDIKIPDENIKNDVSKEEVVVEEEQEEYDVTKRDYPTTMVVHGPTRGFLSLNLWQILLRIIGIGTRGGSSSSGSSNSSSNAVNRPPSTTLSHSTNNRTENVALQDYASSGVSSSPSRTVLII